ncbi:MAG: phytanoyl-CoA dioxygenase family protein [Pyrinomonadaceae bacterium]
MFRNLARETRRKELFWRYGFNLVPSLNYRFRSEGDANRETRNVLERLDREGIAITSIDELPELGAAFYDLDLTVKNILENRRTELNKLKLQANDKDKIGEKTFNVELLGSEVEFQPKSVFARFALHDALLNIANNYFRMLVKLRYYNVWLTFATKSKPRESQLWHFDREDNYILKVFVYLKDVDEGTGPFTYAPRTHRKGILHGMEPEYFVEKNVRRTTSEQMAAVVPAENWVKATGKKGTIVFADTRGYHKGGESRTSDRLMFTCMFTSPASESKRLLKFPPDSLSFGLTRKQRSALGTS